MFNRLESVEQGAINLVARLAPWIAPVPTAYLIGRATLVHLNWPWPVAVVAALVIESLGLASTATALRLWDYNRAKRKTDPAAPVILALILVVAYFATALTLTILLDTVPQLATYAPALFPILSLTGTGILALRSDHRRRLGSIAQDKAQRRAQRRRRKTAQQAAQDVRPAPALETAQETAQHDALDAQSAPIIAHNLERQQRKDALKSALLEAYKEDPDLGATEAGRLLDVHRNTVYTYTKELEEAGLIQRSEGSVIVLNGGSDGQNASA